MWFIKDTFKKLVVDLNQKKSSDFFTMVAHIISALFSLFCLLAGFIATPYILVLYLNTYKMSALLYLFIVIFINYLSLRYLRNRNYKNPTNNFQYISKIRDITSYIIIFTLLIHNGLFNNSILGGYKQLFIFDNQMLNYITIYLFITLVFYIGIYLAFYITFINLNLLKIKPNK